MKKLDEMTLEELWRLFPISLVKHDDGWKKQFEDEAAVISANLGDGIKIHHIGSTAINNIMAKNIVDILVFCNAEQFEANAEKIKKCGYRLMSGQYQRKSFNKGYTENGFADNVFHLHLRVYGDGDELYFRDYMNDHPEAAAEYEKLKLGLWKKYEFDRDAYTLAKTQFITLYTEKAKTIFKGRY